MSRIMLAMLAGIGVGLSGAGQAQMPATQVGAISKASHDQMVKDADAQLKAAKAACASLAGNAKDVCLADAKGKHSIAKADADAAYKNTAKARESARVAHAQANYDVARERCDDLSGNPKDVCIKEAKAALVKGKADAKVDRVAADTSRDAATTRAEARKDATADKREADYKVALEKCDALAGAAKDSCVGNARAQFGKR